MKRLNSILLGLGLAFLAYLVWKLGPGELWHQISALGWGVLLLVALEGAGNLAHTVGWRYCIDQSNGRIPLVRLFPMALAGYAINYLLPTASIGGEVSRAALLASTRKAPQAVSSVLLDKLMMAVAHLLLVILGAFFLLWQVSLPGQLWAAMALTTLMLTSGILGFLLLQKQGKLGALCRWLVAHRLGGHWLPRRLDHIAQVDGALQEFYRSHPRGLVLSVSWHVLGHSAAILQVWLFFHLLNQPLPLTTVAAAGFLSLWLDLLTFAIPMNLGTLEGSRILAFKTLGCQALLGMGFGVAVRVAQVFWACLGLVSYGCLAVSQGRSLSGRPSCSLANVATELRQGLGQISTLSRDARSELPGNDC